MNQLASFEIDYASGLPVWIQVKNRIAYLIGAGEYAPGWLNVSCMWQT